MLNLRLATADDAAAILNVYAPYIDTPISFETTVPTLAAFQERLGKIMRTYPCLVCEENGQVVGYAYASAFGERAAYQWTAVLSIYLMPQAQGRGIGKALYRALIDLLRMQGIVTLCTIIALPNPASVRLHEQAGFVHMGHFPAAGYKLGAWRDELWMTMQLTKELQPPAPVIPVGQLDSIRVDRLLLLQARTLQGRLRG